MSALIQAGVLVLVCYLAAQFISAASTSSTAEPGTNSRCPECNSNLMRTFSRGTPQHISVDYRYTSTNRAGNNDRVPNKAGSPKAVESIRTPISVRDSPSGSSSTSAGNTVGSNNRDRKTLNQRRPSAASRVSSGLPAPKCSDQLCTEYLTKEDRARFDICLKKVESHDGHVKDGQCRFMSQTHRPPVALASYPGSGNTWLRGLLERATGVCTGFEFCDISMRVKGFAGENIVSGAVLVVKTHGFPNWKGKKRRGGKGVSFESAVVLIRNPLDALVAEWNRRVANNFRGSTVSLTSHVKSAGREMFGEHIITHTHTYIHTHTD